MANDFTGRIWRVDSNGSTPFGSLNVKIESGIWTGGTAADNLTITDAAGRTYTFTFPADGSSVVIPKMGWLESPLTFSIPHGNLNLFLGGK